MYIKGVAQLQWLSGFVKQILLVLMWVLHVLNIHLKHRTWSVIKLSQNLSSLLKKIQSQFCQSHEWGGTAFISLSEAPSEWMIKHSIHCAMIQSNQAFKSIVYLSGAARDRSCHAVHVYT